MDGKKKPPIASREEVEGVFLEDQKISDEQLRRNVAKAAEDAVRSIRKTALNSADIIGMINSEEGAVLDWMYSTLTPQNEQVAVNMGGGGKGKGSKVKRKKDKKGHKVFVDPWTGI